MTSFDEEKLANRLASTERSVESLARTRHLVQVTVRTDSGAEVSLGDGVGAGTNALEQAETHTDQLVDLDAVSDSALAESTVLPERLDARVRPMFAAYDAMIATYGESLTSLRTVVDEYAVSASATVAPTSGWSTVQPEWTPTNYIWRRSRTSTGTTSSVGEPAVLTGNPGTPGPAGAQGTSVVSITVYFLISASQPVVPTASPPPAPWTTTEPTPSPGETRNLYSVVRTVLSNGTWSYGPVSVDAAFTAAKSAYSYAEGLLNGSLAAPTAGDGAGKPIGALWTRSNLDGEIVGYWEWSGTAWQARPLAQSIIPSIVAGMIAVGAIDGMTITGALIRTASSGQRIQFDTFGLRTFDAAGAETARLAAASGGLELSGTVRAGDDDNYMELGYLLGGPGVRVYEHDSDDMDTYWVELQRGRVFLYENGDSGTIGARDGGVLLSSLSAVQGDAPIESPYVAGAFKAKAGFTIGSITLQRRFGMWELSVALTGNVAAGATVELLEPDPFYAINAYPTTNKHAAVWMNGGHTGTAFIRPNGTIAMSQSTGGTRTHPQFTIHWLEPWS